MRLIDADALVIKLEGWTTEVIAAVKEQPTVEERTAEQRWEQYAQSPDCSNCGYTIDADDSWHKFKHCPNCGAKFVEVT